MEVSKGRTTLIIAHRLSTVINADEIIVIEDGNIVERGTHRQLLETLGFYRKLWEIQARDADAASEPGKEKEKVPDTLITFEKLHI